MQEFILKILKEIELDKEYIKLCQNYCDLDNSANFNKKEVESIIKSFDSDFKYITKDRTFLKETTFKDYTVRFFIGFKNGITGFGYLLWREEDNNFHKGNLVTLSEQIDPEFKEKVKYNSPIATSLEDFKEILSKFFDLFELFKQRFKEVQNS